MPRVGTPKEERPETVKKVKAIVREKGLSVIEACKELGVNEKTYYTWKQQVGNIKHKPKNKPKVNRAQLLKIDVPPVKEIGGRIYALVGAPEEIMRCLGLA